MLDFHAWSLILLSLDSVMFANFICILISCGLPKCRLRLELLFLFRWKVRPQWSICSGIESGNWPRQVFAAYFWGSPGSFATQPANAFNEWRRLCPVFRTILVLGGPHYIVTSPLDIPKQGEIIVNGSWDLGLLGSHHGALLRGDIGHQAWEILTWVTVISYRESQSPPGGWMLCLLCSRSRDGSISGASSRLPEEAR